MQKKIIKVKALFFRLNLHVDKIGINFFECFRKSTLYCALLVTVHRNKIKKPWRSQN